MDVDVAAPSGAESALEEAAGASGATSDAPRAEIVYLKQEEEARKARTWQRRTWQGRRW